MVVNQPKIFTPFPSIQASEITISQLADTQLRISVTRGNGIGVILVGKLTASLTYTPKDTQTYIGNSVFGSGEDLGGGNYVLYKGTSISNLLITGLTESTSYTFYAYEYNAISNGYEQYNSTTASNNPKSATTIATPVAPSVQATNLIFLGLETLHLTRGNGLNVLILKNEGGAIDGSFLPVDGQTYTVGQNLGGGNIVVGNNSATEFFVQNLPYDTSVAFRAFEYNIAAGSTLYFTNTATGNPITNTINSPEAWYLHLDPIVQPANYAYNMREISQVVSKASILGFVETSIEYLIFFIADNNANTLSTPWHFDQTFLVSKQKSDGLPFDQGWVVYADISGEPIPVFEFYDETVDPAPSYTIQNHLCNPIALDDNNFIAAYIANEGNIATRYSLGIARSSDAGRTWVRNSTFVARENGSRSFYHPVLYKGASNYYITVENSLTGLYEVWKSTDGLTGNTYTRIITDFIGNADLWYEGENAFGAGWQAIGPMWSEGGNIHFLAARHQIGSYKVSPNVHPTWTVYFGGIMTQVVEAYVTTLDSATTPIIIKTLYTTDSMPDIAIYPGSLKISHGGQNHVVCSSFNWKIENLSQVSIDIHLLSTASLGGNTVGRRIWQSEVSKFFIPHDERADDMYQGIGVSPLEVISGTAGSLIGSPTIFALNRIFATSSDYVTFPSWTHDTQYFGFKFLAPGQTGLTDSVDRALFEKAGTISCFLYQGRYLEVWLYGDNGNIKKYRSSSTWTDFSAQKYGPNYSLVGATFLFNGSDDIIVKLNVDDYLDIPVTAIHSGAQKFTNIAQNSNVMKIGNVSGKSTETQPIGALVMFEGSGLTQDKWHKFNWI